MLRIKESFLRRLWYNGGMSRKTFKEGFTLVELSLSMVFIGILSISIVLIINNTVSAYRRGMTLSRINTTGIGLVDDMRAAVQNSSVRTLRGGCALFYSQTSYINCTNDSGYRLVTAKKSSRVTINHGGKRLENVPIYGVFCTGTYSYIWNSGYFDADDATFTEKDRGEWAKLRYKIRTSDADGNISVVEKEINSSVEDEDRPFRLLKVEDNSRAVCAAATVNNSGTPSYLNSNTGMTTNVINLSRVGGELQSEPEEVLIADNNNNLAFYDLNVAQPVESPDGGNAFYSVSFILGTIGSGINVIAKGNACATPSDYKNEYFDYCAINKFNFAVQVNGG